MANTSFVVFAQAADGAVSATAAAPAAETTTIQADASASGSGQQVPPPSNTMMMVPFIILIGVMIAISVRTSSKEKKKREEMMNSIRKGTKIMTTGGILGEIAEVQKDQFLLKVANNVQIAISRSAVAQVIQPAADAADTKAEVTKK
jgi:preprotein translocase subunit YajC